VTTIDAPQVTPTPMVVSYEAPINHSVWRAPGEPKDRMLEQGPPFARMGAGSNRWHRIRSAYVSGMHGRTICILWCGPHASVGHVPHLRANTRPSITSPVFPTGDGLPLCGTCEGRYLGAHPEVPELRFDPRKHTTPQWCPGWGGRQSWSSINAYVEIKNPTPEQLAVGRFPAFCLVCASVVPLRGGGGPYRGWWGLTRHAPGPDLIPPCGMHGWRQLTVHEGRVICRCDAPDERVW
jgi:hypothetical protein